MMKSLLMLAMVGVTVTANAASNLAACDKNNPVVELKTTSGVIDVQLNKAKAPISVKNFLAYVNAGFYNGKIFHRVIPGFMIQGGGFDKEMSEAQTKAPIKNEANNGLKNDKYTIAMARTQDPDSATAQFFINVNDNNFLNYSSGNPGYAVFGKVVKGNNVVDKIAGVTTTNVGMNQNVPVNPVIIKSAEMLSCGK